MVAVHRLSADIYEADFDLIAVHSHLKDYALAYALNLHLKTGFRRRIKDLEVSSHMTLPIFEWKDDIKERYWTFFANSGRLAGKSSELKVNEGLFKEETAYDIFHLVPEFKEADYLLKIEQEGFDGHHGAGNISLVKALQNIPKVLLAYCIDIENLKSRNNLIF